MLLSLYGCYLGVTVAAAHWTLWAGEPGTEGPQHTETVKRAQRKKAV
jgi:hypothetical protein